MGKESLTHRERLERTLTGERTDRVPVALWRHFPVDDQTPENLAKATLAFQKTYDFDLVKVTPSSAFCLQDWGAVDQWKGATEGTREYAHRVVQQPEDWTKLARLDPRKGALGDQVRCLEIICSDLGQDVPVLQTVFSPLAQAKNLVGGEDLLVHIRRYPDAVHQALQIIAQTTIDFVEAIKPVGIAGIFYAVQHAQTQLLSEAEFLEFGKKYDLEILSSIGGCRMNMVHLHGKNVMYDAVADYPVQMINWHDRSTPPSLAEAQGRFPGILCGGLERWDTMVLGDPESIRKEALNAIEQTGGTRFMLGTGCVLPIIAPYGNIMAARQVVEA